MTVLEWLVLLGFALSLAGLILAVMSVRKRKKFWKDLGLRLFG